MVFDPDDLDLEPSLYSWEQKMKIDGMWTSWETHYGDEPPEPFMDSSGEKVLKVRNVTPLYPPNKFYEVVEKREKYKKAEKNGIPDLPQMQDDLAAEKSIDTRIAELNSIKSFVKSNMMDYGCGGNDL